MDSKVPIFALQNGVTFVSEYWQGVWQSFCWMCAHCRTHWSKNSYNRECWPATWCDEAHGSWALQQLHLQSHQFWPKKNTYCDPKKHKLCKYKTKLSWAHGYALSYDDCCVTETYEFWGGKTPKWCWGGEKHKSIFSNPLLLYCFLLFITGKPISSSASSASPSSPSSSSPPTSSHWEEGNYSLKLSWN